MKNINKQRIKKVREKDSKKDDNRQKKTEQESKTETEADRKTDKIKIKGHYFKVQFSQLANH